MAFHYETGSYERIYYTKNDETDLVEIQSKQKAFILDVTETELRALEALRAFNGDTYELIDEKFTEFESIKTENEEKGAKIIELEAQNSTLITEQEELYEASEIQQDQIEAFELSVQELTSTVDELQSFKDKAEKEAK